MSLTVSIRIKFIFHCTAHQEIFERSWFRLTVLVVILLKAENKKVLSAKSFWLDCKPVGKSFMYIKNNKGLKNISVERLYSRLSTIRTDDLKLLFVDDFSKYPLKDRAACLLCCFLRFIIPTCHTLSKTFHMSRNIALSSKLLSKEVKLSWG